MEDTYKKCPYCAEDIKLDAIKCKHCGELLNKISTKPIEPVKEDNEKNKNPFKVSTLLSIGLIISFFLPWFSLLNFDINGFSIPTKMDKITYLIFLIPLSAVINIFIDFGRQNRKYFLNEFAIALFCSCILYIWLYDKSNELTNALGVGFYLTVIISTIGFIWTSPIFEKIIHKR